MTLPYEKTASLSINWAYVCITMVWKKQSTVKNTVAPCQQEKGCFCEHPCFGSKYGRIVHIQQKDNPRIFNIPPRDSKEWKLEYNKQISIERSNKRKKIDYKLEDGRHRSSKMWYCRLYAIMMLQHLDTWGIPTRVDTIFTFSRMATSK